MKEYNTSSDLLSARQYPKNGKAKHDVNIGGKNTPFVKTPLISVVIPAYKEEKILGNMLGYFSASFKSLYNLEVIVSDGGSDDDTVKIALDYADKVVVHDSPHKQTIAEGRNRGAELATGDIIVFLNADSFPADPDFFFKYITEWATGLNNESESIALACYVSAFPNEIIFKDRIFYLIHNFYVWLLNFIGLGMGRGECQIVKRDFFRYAGGYNPALAAGEDFDLYRRLSQTGKVKFVRNLRVHESPRRFRKYGYFRIVFSWTLNSLAVMILGRSLSREWEAVR